MANPQKEDGYTAIANEIMDALCKIRIPAAERSVLDAILRKTYGWNKCEDELSMGQIAEMTGIKRPNVARALKYLAERKFILVIRDDNSKCNILKFNKNYEQWVLSRVITVIRGDNKGVIRSAQKGVISTDTHKRKNIQKQIKTISSSEISYQLAELLFLKISERNPNHKKPDLQSWAKDIDLMIRRDARDPTTIKAVIEWCQKDSFWQNNILSTGKLREKFDQLNLKMGSNGHGRSTGGAVKAPEKAGRARSDGAEYPTDHEF